MSWPTGRVLAHHYGICCIDRLGEDMVSRWGMARGHIGHYWRKICYPARTQTLYSYDLMALPKIPMLGPQRSRYAECKLSEVPTLRFESSPVVACAVPLNIASRCGPYIPVFPRPHLQLPFYITTSLQSVPLASIPWHTGDGSGRTRQKIPMSQ